MALVLADRVRVSSSTTGTGAMSLSSSPVAGYQSFAAVGDGNTTYYTIAAGDQWEVGEGTYTASTNSLSRDSVFSSSNAGAKVDFAYGTKDVFVTLPATIASTAAADADAAAQSAQDAADDAAAADADRILAEAAAASSSANAARFSPYITVPAAASSLNRLVYVELYKYVGSTAISIPTRITVRDFARDSLNRFRLNLSSFDGVSTYTLVLAESAPPALFISAAGFTGLKNLDLYTTGTSFGVPSGTKIGVARVDFGDGSAFGSYNANNITWSVGGLYTEAMVTNAAQDATTNGLILTNTQLSYLTSSQSLFVTTPSATSSVTVQGLLACVGISIYPSYPLGDSLVLVRECGRRSSDSFFRMQLATYDGVSAYTLLAATNNNNPIGASGYTGIYTFDLKAQSGNALGIAAGTVIGQVQINFGTGAAFGTYATSIPYSAGAVYNTRIQESTAVTEQLIDTALLNYTPSPFLTSVDNDYMRSIVDDIRIDFGVAGREYVLNVRSDTAGSTRRLTFFLYDPIRGANIAIWARQASYDFASELPPSIYLSGAALGTKRNDVEYVGTGCTIFINKDNIQFNKGVTTYTTPAQGGINSDRVWSVEQTKQAIMSGVGVKNTMVTFGPDGDFASLELAVNSLFSTGVLSAAGDNPNNIQRAWWPFSDTCTPASQWTLQALPGCVEIKNPVKPAGVDYARGILCWMGMTIQLLDDTELKAESVDGVETYFFDYNLGGRILATPNTLISTNGPTTEAVHQDAGNSLSVPSDASLTDPTAGLQFFCITGLITNGRYTAANIPWAAGVSDGQDIVFSGSIFHVTGLSGGNNFVAHTSPNNSNPGYYTFDNVTFLGGPSNMALITSNPVVARHGITVSNSDIATLSAGASGAGFVRIGKQPGVSYSAGLEP